MTVIISPTNGTNVKGIITFEATKIPSDTSSVTFILMPPGSGATTSAPTTEQMKQWAILSDSNGVDGYTAIYDTKSKVNGVYQIFVGTKTASGTDWSTNVNGQMIVGN
jgi:hypothetical protein